MLAYADYKKPFILHVDASRDGLGAVLCQKGYDGQVRVIGYGIRALSRAERNYAVHKLEFLALKWSVTEKCHDYLYGNCFTVLTDNNPLTYVLTTARLGATGHRWLAALAAYDFKIKCRPGTTNIDADLLSRLPKLVAERVSDGSDVTEQTTDRVRTVSQESISALCQALILEQVPVDKWFVHPVRF